MSLSTGPDIITLKGNVNGNVILLIINSYVSNLVYLNKNIVIKNYEFSYIESKRQDNIGGVGPYRLQGETHTDPLI